MDVLKKKLENYITVKKGKYGLWKLKLNFSFTFANCFFLKNLFTESVEI